MVIDSKQDYISNIELDFIISKLEIRIDITENPEILNGVYEGVKKSLSVCADAIFPISTGETITIAIAETDISITQDSFFDGVCEFTGTISTDTGDISANSTFRCSNFDEGTWSSSKIAKTGEDSFLAILQVNVENRACNYQVKYIGFNE